MFLGEHQHTLDGKGRLVLPSKFREGLADGCVVTKGQERCLYVFPADRWEEEATRVNRMPRTDKRARSFARAFFASAAQAVPDRQGRIALPKPLRDYAGLDKDVTVLGVADRVELWDAPAWTDASVSADDYYAEIEEALSEHGI